MWRFFMVFGYPFTLLATGNYALFFSTWPCGFQVAFAVGCLLRNGGGPAEEEVGSEGRIFDSVIAVTMFSVGFLHFSFVGDALWTPESTIPAFVLFCFCLLVQHAIDSALGSARRQLTSELEKSHQLTEQLNSTLGEVSGKLSKTRLAFSRIVSGLCDCSFRLDDDLKILDPPPQLHDLLCAGQLPDQIDLAGQSLGTFVPAADARSMRSALAASDGDVQHGAAAAMAVELLDASGEQILADVYHTRVDQNEHMVVLRVRGADENTRGADGRPPHGAEQGAEDPSPSAARPLPASHSYGWPDDPVPGGGLVAGRPESTTAALEEHAPAGALVSPRLGVLVDSGHPDLELMGPSLFCAEGDNACLLDWMDNRTRGAFNRWIVDEGYNAFMPELERRSALGYPNVLSLRLPSQVNIRAARATAQILEQNDEGQIPTMVWLEGVTLEEAERQYSPLQEGPDEDITPWDSASLVA